MMWNKDWLMIVCFTVDALNTIFTFPLFVTKGSKWVLKTLAPDAKEKSNDVDDVTVTATLDDCDRKSFQLMWELFMICYEGYFGFTISTLICIYKIPETIPIFAYSLFVLYLYKLKVLLTAFNNTNDDPQRQAKIKTILYFFLPCYGGYCILHLLEQF